MRVSPAQIGCPATLRTDADCGDIGCQSEVAWACSFRGTSGGDMSETKGVEHWAAAEFQRNVVGPIEDFQDPSQEWRRLFSELLGTFFLVLVAAGGGMMNQAFDGAIGRAAAVTAPGLMVLAIILFMGKVSGAHLNPAVSLAFALRRNFPWIRVPGYILAQLIG